MKRTVAAQFAGIEVLLDCAQALAHVRELFFRQPRALKLTDDILRVISVHKASGGGGLARGARHDAGHALHRPIDCSTDRRWARPAETRAEVVGNQVVHHLGPRAPRALSRFGHHADPQQLAEVRIERVGGTIERLGQFTDRAWCDPAHRLE